MPNELWLFKQLLNYAISGYPHQQNTLQPELWIKYALSGSSGIFEIGKTKNVEEVLSLLSQGISANPTSTKLWTVYLELTKQCQKSKPEEVRVIFRDAILNLPDSVHIQWQLYLWETQEDRKVDVLYTIIRIICKKNGLFAF
ncbi:hypothetical protein BC833DRAFT_52569 [Globomyces pollinis-pini]|nr:hypothetical protein BC833DRAFT_52569 [Globomyces pollinis-pini]